MRLRAVAIVITIVAVSTVAWGQVPELADDESSAVLAIVDGRPVTADELWWHMSQTDGGRLLDELILARLLAAEAAAQGVKVAEPDVDDALAALRAGHGSESAFARWLIESGQTLKGLRMQLQQELLIEALLARGRHLAVVGDAAARQEGFEQLNEALGYALQGGYRICEADIRIALALAYRAAGDASRAAEQAARARALSEEMGYAWGVADAAAFADNEWWNE